VNKDSKIYVAGHLGLVGSAIMKKLKNQNYSNIVTKTRKDLDLKVQADVDLFFQKFKPEYVFLAAAQVGGIIANNNKRAEFIYNNIMIQSNIIHCSYKYKVKKLLFLGSSCVYPKNIKNPIKENSLLSSELEYTNEPYAIAKIAGLKMCESYNIQYGTNFISVMPTNLYGYNDNFNLDTSHVLPAIFRKIYLGKCLLDNNWEAIISDITKRPLEKVIDISSNKKILAGLAKYGVYEKSIEIWGSGNPLREFLWSDELADACLYVMQNTNFQDLCDNYKEIRNTHINIGSGKEISIKELAILIKNIVGYKGDFFFNTSKPDGTFKKLIDNSKISSLGWKNQVSLKEGISRIYNWYIE